MKDIATPMEWSWVGGPSDPSIETKLTKQVRASFSEHSGHEWVKKMGGKKYSKDVKICGHHIYNKSLREVESSPKRPRID